MGLFDIPGIKDLNKAVNGWDNRGQSSWWEDFESIYSITWTNWYKSMPYCFRFRDKNGKETDFYLPINPSNLQITTHFATNIISTLYGTVEEHSEQRYFDIVISGTTGMAPKFYIPKERGTNKSRLENGGYNSTEDNPAIGRQSFDISAGNLALGGFATRTQETVKNAISQGISLGQSFGLIDTPDAVSGINEQRSGYAAFHNLYRFLLLYKKDVISGTNIRKKSGNSHPLKFINYKDSNQYNVAIQTFNLTKSAEDPMLYNYTIIMRGYNITQSDRDGETVGQIDAESLGLTGVDSSSYFAKMSNLTRKAKNVVYSTAAALKGVGS